MPIIVVRRRLKSIWNSSTLLVWISSKSNMSNPFLLHLHFVGRKIGLMRHFVQQSVLIFSSQVNASTNKIEKDMNMNSKIGFL